MVETQFYCDLYPQVIFSNHLLFIKGGAKILNRETNRVGVRVVNGDGL
ncbi:hypothetical protein [Nostoc sp.]